MRWTENFTYILGVTAPYADKKPPLGPHHDSMAQEGAERVFNDSGLSLNEGNQPLATPHLLYWYYINGLAGTAIALFGLVGNTASILILTHRTMRNSTSILLIFMAIFDNLFLLLNLLLQTFPFIFVAHDICPEYIHVRQFLFKNFYAVVHMAHTATIYMTMLVTVERAMVVMRPLRAKYICTRRRAVLVSLAVLLWAVVYNIPRCLVYGTQIVSVQVDAASNETLTELLVDKTDFAHSTFYNRYYLVYFNSLVHFVFPFLVILVLNAMIITRLVRRRRNLSRTQRSGLQVESESKLTVMILSLTVVFCVCQVFAAVELIIVQLEKDYSQRLGHCSRACEGFSAFAETMTIVNSATNFLLYSIFGEKFRRACVRYICPLGKSRQTNGVTVQRTSHSVLTSSYRGETFQLRHTESLES
ncbi:FMRFamide receptor-like [Babylonia areolata]|uniref:FMRFamide receptor-like n=1 Tax=Babylonia areolata TaxID=304850 RepID=UPI003FD1ED40